ncbi:hypothetical protein M378DRAFT_16962 [Amanita muscaria Koide BX008]|uniref:Retrotransposon gag domain-containing protein n=1 Tax=Amanita muscaria (strain Koide BX008) TaxID=946122 RepID=A0A0C2WIW3_AMAMK|nr:hypothetical protein M378DRAFT_16962 [Amanita muscaria Koide BX008]
MSDNQLVDQSKPVQSNEEGNTSGTSEEFVDADQLAELEYVEQEQPEETEQDQDESSESSSEEEQLGTGAQTVTHVTPLPPLQIALPPLPLSPPPPPPLEPSPPEVDVEMSQATVPQNNYQGGGGAKLPLPEDFIGVRSKCTGFLASIRAYFNFYLNQFATDAQKITLALMSCKGAASTWRDSEFAKFDTDPVSHGTWTEFRTRFINQWEEVSAMASAMIKIQKLKLGGKYNMTQLISRFDELIPYCKIQDNEPMKIHFFNQAQQPTMRPENMPPNSAWPMIESMRITGSDPDMELLVTTIMVVTNKKTLMPWTSTPST